MWLSASSRPTNSSVETECTQASQDPIIISLASCYYNVVTLLQMLSFNCMQNCFKFQLFCWSWCCNRVFTCCILPCFEGIGWNPICAHHLASLAPEGTAGKTSGLPCWAARRCLVSIYNNNIVTFFPFFFFFFLSCLISRKWLAWDQNGHSSTISVEAPSAAFNQLEWRSLRLNSSLRC